MPDADATTKLEISPSGRQAETSPQPVVPGGPVDLIPLAEAAALAFLGVLALGTVLLIALKFQYPNVGSGADVVDVLTGVVILSLAALRVPVHVGNLTLTVLPLGALVGVFLIVRWACRATAPKATARSGPIVGAMFALMSLASALIFRFRFESDPIYAGAPGAFLAAFIWISLFSSVSFATSQRSLLRVALGRLERWRETGRESLSEGIQAGAVMVTLGALLATAAGLLWIIVVMLSGGGPRDLDGGDVIGALLYVIAFAPNLIVTVLAMSLGAPVDVGAGLTIGGVVRGQLREWTIFDQGAAVMLLLVPVAACVLGGYWARRNAKRPELAVRTLGVAALSFASTLALLSWLGTARLGAQLASSRGFGVVAPRAWVVFVLAILWAALGGLAGWKLSERRT